jgi:hypothetical protein
MSVRMSFMRAFCSNAPEAPYFDWGMPPMAATDRAGKVGRMKKTLIALTVAVALPAAFAAGAKDLFAGMDSNRDGRISAAEHARGSRAMFVKMDADRDGRVTADEMSAAQPAVTGRSAQAAAMSSADKIRVIDTNGDGVLSAAEHADGSKAMFAKMDRNKDQRLSRAEYTAGHKQLMARRD